MNRPKSKILCIDDDPTFTLLYKKYLTEEGYDVLVGKSAEEGLQFLETFTPDLIISDMVMPGISGLDFCKEFRKNSKYKNAIFLLVSALKTNAEDAIEALEGGADDYILKPFDKSSFLAKVKAFLRIKSLQDKLADSNEQIQSVLDSLQLNKVELENKNRELEQEKEVINNSFKQISMMAKQLEETNEKLQRNYLTQQHNFSSIVTILSTLIEGRRQGHRGHAKTVAEISSYIAKKMGLDENAVKNIEIAALLHEIGKFGIPDELALKKPNEYTESERTLLFQHPFMGSELLANYSGFEEVAKIIRHFHEKVDGTGEPDQLAGKEIPVGSRIICVANFYENIVFRSSIDSPFPVLDEQAGKIYDPAVINYLRQYVDEYDPKNVSKATEVTMYELESGMELVQDVLTKSGIKLMHRNTVLTQESIDRMIKYNKIDPIEGSFYIKG